MKEKEKHANMKKMQNQARAVSNGEPATSEEIKRRRKRTQAQKRKRREQKIERTTTEYRRKAVPFGYRQIAVFILCFAVFLSFCVLIVYSEAVLKENVSQMNSLQASYEELQLSNDELEAKIHYDIDVNEIYRIATEELGMIYPKKSQIMAYQKTEGEYVRQNEDIPR